MRRTLLLLILVALLAVPTATTAASSPKQWKPGWNSAVSYAKGRAGIIGIALRTPSLTYGWNATRTMPSASVFKAMALVAYLRMKGSKKLNSSDRSLLYPMIHRSDDHAANRVVAKLGSGRILKLARLVPMYRFHYNTHGGNSAWGRSRIDAADQARFMLKIDKLMPKTNRAYGMHLLGHITASQRWGIAQAAPKGWHVYFKSGWGLGTGWVDHQVVLLTRGNSAQERVSIAVLQQHIGNSHAAHEYGKRSLKGIFLRLLKGLGNAPAGSVR